MASATWSFADATRSRRGGPTRAGDSLVDVTLDRAQRAIVELPRGRNALVLGEAGHGKTTVALYRLAHLVRNSARRYRAIVIVPTEPLRALLAPACAKLGADVPVMTYDAFAAKQARRAFPDLPKRESTDATAAVIRFKRDPALAASLTEIAARGAKTRHRDLLHLFGDTVLLDRVSLASARPYDRAALGDVLEHTKVQFGKTTEEAFSHVTDKKRLVAVDRLALDVGTPTADAGTIDVEDYAVLFELDRMRAERRRAAPIAPRAYDCIIVDEAQELAPLELALVGRSLAPKGTLVVAGDADQQVDPAVTFTSWDQTMRDMRCDDYARSVLSIGYRCPPRVVALARHVLDAASPPPEEREVARFDTRASLVAELGRAIDRLQDDDGRENVAIVCRTQLAARRFADDLRAHVPCRLVLGEAFFPGPGVSVTWVGDVKGLEFDHVVVPDLESASYPDTREARRALYVAITRARVDVSLGCAGVPSSIVRTRS
jgi:superfamily I DNA/RNA helicase